jgi:ribosomal protein S18 acetylase RimI-like enzyme
METASINNFAANDSQIRFVDSERDVDAIAFLHKSPEDRELKKSLFRFYKDKVGLFLEFDPQSVLIRNGKKNDIAGFLIYTYDTDRFNAFAGPSGTRFYKNILKTAAGYYGYDFRKYIAVCKVMLGINRTKFTSPVSEIHPYGKIWALVVSSEYRRMGFASELIAACLKTFREKEGAVMRITVKKDNEPAIKTYQNYGFEIIGECLESTGESFVMEIKS